MREATKIGISFGVTSGIITTLGLMVGLNTGTGLRLAVIGGILTIAIADAFSDAFGIHISQESRSGSSNESIWRSTFVTFFTKLFVALSFLVPVFLFNLSLAVKINLAWGFFLLVVFNYWLAKIKKESPFRVIGSHLFIATVVVIATFLVGKLIAAYF